MDTGSPTALTTIVVRHLQGLSGVIGVAPVGPATLPAVGEAEDLYERDAGVPLWNLGMRRALGRSCVVALLKDGSFRRPPTPTLYLVEEVEGPPSEMLVLDGRSYHVIGVECAPGDEPPEGTVALSDTFVLYPDRRGDTTVVARFLLPPIRFPELEASPWTETVRGVVSASPSAHSDRVIREHCGFPRDPRLATLVLGFDPISPA